MRLFPLLAILLFCSGQADADYGLGFTVDTSSNMLLRPDGLSGTIASMYGGAGFDRGPMRLVYNTEAGAVERYEGIQYHSHALEFSATRSFGAGDRPFEATLRSRVALTRLGEVSFLGGYDDYRFFGAIKAQAGESSLFRGEAGVVHRGFTDMSIETYDQIEGFIQFDRFLETGTTLRGRIDGGVRRYGEIGGEPVTSLLDVRVRIAQSLGAKTGIWMEFHNRFVNNESSPDSSARSERRLFEDAYKSSAFGGTFHVTRLTKNRGSIQLNVSIERKRFGRNLAGSYNLLPLDGWDETEGDYSLSYSPHPDFLPQSFHPLIRIYHMRADTSISGFSYRSTGISVDFSLF